MTKMMNSFCLILLIIISDARPEYPIKHVVVLMMENQSFDHMLGWMTKGGPFGNPNVDGLTGQECNTNEGITICVSDQAVDQPPYDPDHSHQATTERIYNCEYEYFDKKPSDSPCLNHSSLLANATMGGFLFSAQRDMADGYNEMTMLSPEKIPILTTLANEYALFDHYFASYPGPTNPNRLFVHCGTAAGSLGDEQRIGQMKNKTIQKILEENGHSWRYYYEDQPEDWFLFISDFNDTFEDTTKFLQMEQFYTDAEDGNLPEYTFINPTESYNPDLRHAKSYGLMNDQHPSHSIKEGERLIKNVYEALRNGPLWNETLLIINYDEHGGFYDHVPPPQGEDIPNPDGINNSVGFTFQRLGLRVPMLAISPWIEKGLLVNKPSEQQKPFPNSEFEHSSIIATIQKIFGIESQVISKRTAWAATFDDLLLTRDSPRVDCLERLPDVPPPTQEDFKKAANSKLKSTQKRKIEELCQLFDRDNEHCGQNITNAQLLWEFQMKYHLLSKEELLEQE